jgi:uncharacterized protein
MQRFLAALAGVIVLALASPVLAAETPIPPSPTTWVTDTVSLLSPATRDTLEQRLAAYNKETGHQVIVYIGSTTGDAPLEDWTIRAFTAWKVGRKKLDDGLAIFMFTQDRKVRIEVGYGLEGVMTDAIASQIIRNDIMPRMKAGDADGAVTAAVDSVLATIGGEHGAAPRPPAQSSSDLTGVWVALIIFLIFIFIVIRTIRRFGSSYTIGSGPFIFGGGGSSSGGGFWGGFSGGDGGGGGFSGGGGGGGGGGASGGW